MKEYFISPYTLSNGFNFLGAFVFCENDTAFLINRNTGTSIILNEELLNTIENQSLGEDLQLKLVQRFLGQYHESKMPNDVLKIVLPRYFMINVTSQCNLRCKYCFREHEASGTISKEMILKICDFINNYCLESHIDCINIQPWGGEPLIAYERIIDIDDYFKKTNIKATIAFQTNGTLLTDDRVAELNSRKIGFGISIDGIKDINDQQRVFCDGSGTYDKICEGIHCALKNGCDNIGAISVITTKNIGHIYESLKELIVQHKAKSIKCNVVKQTKQSDIENFNEIQIQDFAIELLNAVIKLRLEGFCFQESNIIERLHNLLNRSNSNICNSNGCTGGKRMVSFDSYGNIFPCEMVDFPDEKLGDIFNNQPLHEMIERAIIEKDYFSDKYDTKCDKCPWWSYCKGGCSTSLKYQGCAPNTIDKSECSFNIALYSAIVKLIVEHPNHVKLLLCL